MFLFICVLFVIRSFKLNIYVALNHEIVKLYHYEASHETSFHECCILKLASFLNLSDLIIIIV